MGFMKTDARKGFVQGDNSCSTCILTPVTHCGLSQGLHVVAIRGNISIPTILKITASSRWNLDQNRAAAFF